MAATTTEKANEQAKPDPGKFTGETESKPKYNVERFEKFKSMDVDGLVTEGVRLVKHYVKMTEYFRELAEVIVALRMKCRYQNIPDWGGKSDKYNKLVQDIYSQAGLATADEGGLRNAIRYHIQNLVKEVAPEAHLIKLGIKTEKRGAGGNAGSNGVTVNNQPTKNGEVVGTASAAQVQSANKIAKLAPPEKDPVVTLQVIKLEIQNNIKNLAYVTEQVKGGIGDNDQRFKVVRTADEICKLANSLAEQAAALSMRHQGRTPEQIEKDTAKPTKANTKVPGPAKAS